MARFISLIAFVLVFLSAAVEAGTSVTLWYNSFCIASPNVAGGVPDGACGTLPAPNDSQSIYLSCNGDNTFTVKYYTQAKCGGNVVSTTYGVGDGATCNPMTSPNWSLKVDCAEAKKLKTAAIIGIVIGVFFFLLICFCLCIWYRNYRRREQQKLQAQQQGQQQQMGTMNQAQAPTMQSNAVITPVNQPPNSNYAAPPVYTQPQHQPQHQPQPQPGYYQPASQPAYAQPYQPAYGQPPMQPVGQPVYVQPPGYQPAQPAYGQPVYAAQPPQPVVYAPPPQQPAAY